jgi:hypothetical protein
MLEVMGCAQWADVRPCFFLPSKRPGLGRFVSGIGGHSPSNLIQPPERGKSGHVALHEYFPAESLVRVVAVQCE